MKQHEVNLEAVKEKHRMEMESKDKEHGYKLDIMQKEHELKAQEQKQSMTNNIATDAMSDVTKNLMQNPDEALKMMDNLLKFKEMAEKFPHKAINNDCYEVSEI